MPLHSRFTLTVLLLAVLLTPIAAAQPFSSGSTGADGALTLTTPGLVELDPALDLDGDGIYNFTTITIGAGVTVEMRADRLGTQPVVWLATGDVVIDGTLDLNGEDGYPTDVPTMASVGGAGGYRGGLGQTETAFATTGSGPGGGQSKTGGGGGGGHRENGTNGVSASGGTGGSAYGNFFLMPLIGGSGGGGGGSASNLNATPGAGGGAGGGAILIASSTEIVINGGIEARGGNGGPDMSGSTQKDGGGGSGGSIRLLAGIISGTGTLNVDGGVGDTAGGFGSAGRVRLEAIQHNFAGTSDSETRFVTPGLVFPPSTSPRVRVTAVDGVSVPANPTGATTVADLTIDAGGPITISLEANNIPLGTTIDLIMVSETRERMALTSTPLAGTFGASTATATATIPHGFSIFSIQASWTP